MNPDFARVLVSSPHGASISSHVLAADGAFVPGGRFVALPRVPAHLLAEGFGRAVLDFPVKNEALSKEKKRLGAAGVREELASLWWLE